MCKIADFRHFADACLNGKLVKLFRFHLPVILCIIKIEDFALIIKKEELADAKERKRLYENY